MGVDIKQITYKDGEIPMDPASEAYFGGQPAKIGAAGASLLKTETGTYIGIFKNSSYEDAKNGNVTIIRSGKVEFLNGSNAIDSVINGQTVEGAPYDTTKTYAAGEYLYIDANGKWSNTGTAGRERGIIVRPATASDGSMEAYLFDVK